MNKILYQLFINTYENKIIIFHVSGTVIGILFLLFGIICLIMDKGTRNIYD